MMNTCLPQSTHPTGQILVTTNVRQALTDKLQSTDTLSDSKSSTKEKNQLIDDHRPTRSSSDSGISIITMKSRLKNKQRGVLSSSSDDSNNDSVMRKLKMKDKNDATSSQNQKKTKRNNRTKNKEKDSLTKRKTGRKNIRKIIHDKDLNVKTKYAIEVERQRRKRLAKIQKLYNTTLLRQSSFIPNSKSYKSEKSNLRLILEFDKKTNKSYIEVSTKLVAHLKKHQYDGIKFLWNNVYESIDAIKTKKQNTNGCILAHCMGLGKTLQVISFIHTAFNYSHITKVKTCLVLSPVNAALNWSNEFNFWLKDIEPSINHYQLTTVEPGLRVEYLNKWHENGGVLIMGYQMYVRLVKGVGIKNKKIQIDAYHCLVDPGPDIVVADEGHILKNSQTSIANCLSKIKTSRRIVLTGTPLQNNLLEYYCMISFIKPNLLGDRAEYINRFVNPIKNGQHSDSNEQDVYLMKKRAYVLNKLLTGFVDRKDHSLLKEYLPPKFEYIINIRLSDLQSRLYYLYLQVKVAQKQRSPILKKDFKSAKLFADYQHPFLLYPYFFDRWKKGLEENHDDDGLSNDNELEDMFIDDNELETVFIDDEENKSPLENNLNDFSMNNIRNEVDEYKSLASEIRKRKTSTSSIATLDFDSTSTDSDEYIDIGKDYSMQNKSSSTTIDSSKTDIENNKNSLEGITYNDNEKENSIKPWLDEMRKQFWFRYLDSLPNQSEFDVELSGKIILLKSIIDKCAEIGDKILVFSRSLYSLDYIEKFLKHLHIQNEKQYQTLLSEKNNRSIPTPVQWISEKDYFRIDGKTKIILRKSYIETFNDPSNSRVRLFLISTTAGGIGINLTASNRIIVFDASWNPSNDAQALFRSYRLGQKKSVYVYRFVSHGTMEEKIYQRQVVKQSVSKRYVIDDHQIDRHFTRNDIKELYDFQLEQLSKVQSILTYPKESNTDLNLSESEDHLLFDLLNEHRRWIYSYHSHDSLLENKIDENLSPEERRQALEEYETLQRLPIQRQSSSQRLPPQQLNSLVANNIVIHNIPARAKWKQNGVTIVGDARECNDIDQIYWPVDLFVHDDETIIFTDWANDRVVRCNITSKNIEVVAGGNRTGSRLDQLNRPIDVLMDKTTNSLIICDRGNRRVIRQSCHHGITKTEIFVNNVDCRGLAMDDQGLLYIADYRKHVVKRYRIGDQNETIVAGGNGKGNGLHQLNKPRYLFIDKHQSIYVSDNGNHRVMKWSKYAEKGIIVAGGRGKGSLLTQLSFPYGLFVDALGTVYVADSRNDRVMRWSKDAKYGTTVVGGNGRVNDQCYLIKLAKVKIFNDEIFVTTTTHTM
ncbi:unnamed protein product [Rotaria sp. Silwood1]|nr:unnamed protein product [Rotaria sp. Silwood1]